MIVPPGYRLSRGGTKAGETADTSHPVPPRSKKRVEVRPVVVSGYTPPWQEPYNRNLIMRYHSWVGYFSDLLLIENAE
ncbi:MAG: hypothetical protein CMJ75_12835 [Planctomycetaceae bacterium]|nr:hypothetical protein [Planctomycetaceae bacterium]